MTEEEKEEEVDRLRQSIVMLSKAVMMAIKKRGKPKGPYKSKYESYTTKETALTKRVAAPDSGNPIEIGYDNDNDGHLREYW